MLITGFHKPVIETFRYWLLSQFSPYVKIDCSIEGDYIEDRKGIHLHLLFEHEDIERSSDLLSRTSAENFLIIYHERLTAEVEFLDLPCVSFLYCIDYLKGYLSSPSAASEKEQCVYFTPRESEVLDLFAQGMSVKEVAYELKISKYTVAAHQRNLYLKTDSHSLQQLTLFASLRSQLVSRRGDRE